MPAGGPAWARLAGAASAVIGLAAAGAGIVLLLQGSSGLLPRLNLVLGLGVLMTGNLVCWVLDIICWLGRRRRWLGLLILFQTVPALAALGIAAGIGVDRWAEARADAEAEHLLAAVRQDDPQALAASRCGARCRARLGNDTLLLIAAEAGAHRVAAQLAATSPPPMLSEGSAQTTLSTCEGTLPGLDALSVAVVRDDAEMVRVLLPLAGPAERRRAMWLAARLDRLERLQQLAAAGVPLTQRGEVLDSNESLLVAAAEGAALRVGRWLLEDRHFPPTVEGPPTDPYHGRSPVAAVLQAADTIDPARAAAFLRLLTEHGARLSAEEARAAAALTTRGRGKLGCGAP